MDSTSRYLAPDPVDSGPLPYQGMSPTAVLGATLGSGRPTSFAPQQMPISYGSTTAPAPARQPMANGVAPQVSGQGSSQLHNAATGFGATGGVEGEAPCGVATGQVAYTTTGPDDDGAVRLRVRDGAEQASTQHPPPHSASMSSQQLPLPPTMRQPQQQQQHLSAETTSMPSDVGQRIEGPQPNPPVDMSPGTRLTVEAQRAMAQLASQRTALVQALSSGR